MRRRTFREASCGASGCVVERCGPEGIELVERIAGFVKVGRKRATLVQRGVEGEHPDFILAARQLREHGIERVAGHVNFFAQAHAAAHVDEQGNAHGRFAIKADRQDRFQESVVADVEVGRRQVADRTAPAIAHRRLDCDDVEGAAEGDVLILNLLVVGESALEARRQTHQCQHQEGPEQYFRH